MENFDRKFATDEIEMKSDKQPANESEVRRKNVKEIL